MQRRPGWTVGMRSNATTDNRQQTRDDNDDGYVAAKAKAKERRGRSRRPASLRVMYWVRAARVVLSSSCVFCGWSPASLLAPPSPPPRQSLAHHHVPRHIILSVGAVPCSCLSQLALSPIVPANTCRAIEGPCFGTCHFALVVCGWAVYRTSPPLCALLAVTS